jgi:hypothetical protein
MRPGSRGNEISPMHPDAMGDHLSPSSPGLSSRAPFPSCTRPSTVRLREVRRTTRAIRDSPADASVSEAPRKPSASSGWPVTATGAAAASGTTSSSEVPYRSRKVAPWDCPLSDRTTSS